MTMRRVCVPSALVVALALSACQTIVVQSHRDPSNGTPTFGRALAIVDLSGYEDSERMRRAGETELVNSLPELNLVPSYRDFSLEELPDIAEAKRRASAEGFDGIVLLWVKEIRAETGYFIMDVGLGEYSVAGPSWNILGFSAAVVSVAEGRELWSGVIERRGDKGR